MKKLNFLIPRNFISKFIFLLLVWMAVSVTHSWAQNPAMNEVNLQLRQYFFGLSKPAPAKKFLYEMSAHSTDSAWFVRNSPDTNVTDTWYKVYEEMYYSAYDTTALVKSDFIYNKANNFYSDSIPIGIMKYSFYGLKPDAMSTDIYFNFDTVNNLLSDKNPRPDWPYTDNNSIFMSAPLISESRSANPVFIIDPQFFYSDSFNTVLFDKNNTLQIDFGDGAGWQNFDPTVVSYYRPNYSLTNTEIAVMHIRLINIPTSNIYGSSLSRFFIFGPATVPADSIITIPGLNVGVYNGCNTTAATGKTVIYLEGIDILDVIPSRNRSVDMIYNEMLRNDRIIELKNQGYKFVVVDWRNSRVDMRFNALYVLNLLQVLKQQSTDDQQFVIMGESMGGVIARYVLTYMESRDYITHNTGPFFTEQNDFQSLIYLNNNPVIFTLPTNWVEPEKMHNTRLFISNDAPHQGANIPLSIQKAYESVLGIFGPYIGTVLSITTNAFNLFLDAKAAKQLLIEHVSTESGLGFYKTYTSSPVRTSFMNQLRTMGNYPQFAKVMLMSSGALSGANQVNFYTGLPRVPNDRFIDFKLDTYAKVLGIKIPVFGGNLKALTNPDGDGKILQANAGTYSIRIKLRWFGIKIYAGYNSILNKHDYATTRPYCVNAGGTKGSSGAVSNQASSNGFNLSNNYWAFNLFSYNLINDGAGCLKLRSHLGWNGFLSANVNFDLCSDGFRFGFVPVQSALDYGTLGTIPLNTNLQTLDINTKLAALPAGVDLIVGNPGRPTDGTANRDHVVYRNDGIFNLTNVSTVTPTNPLPFTYFSCTAAGADSRVQRGFLNLEIGDEELYLENNELPYNAEYKVEYDLHVNERNPYYQYSSTNIPLPAQILPGIYSKQDAFSISSTGFATFIFDATNAPPGHLGFYGTTTGSFALIDEPLINCCILFFGNRAINNTSVTAPKSLRIPETNFLKVFPNPNKGENVTLQYQFKNTGKTRLDIFNATGKLVLCEPLYVPNNKIINTTINLRKYNLTPGFYIVKLTNGFTTLTGKIILVK